MEETTLMSPDHLQTSEDTQSPTARAMEPDNTDESVSSVVSDIVQLSVSDLNELMQLIKQWDAEERATPQTDVSAASSTQQNIEDYLKWFFDQRRRFAEDLWDEEHKDVKMGSSKFTTKRPDTLEEPTSSLFAISGDNEKSLSASSPCSMSAILEVTKADGLARKTLFKRIKETWRKRFGRKSNSEGGSFSESQDDEDTKDRSLSRKSDQMSISSKDQKELDEDQAHSLSSFSLHQPVIKPLEGRSTEEDGDHVTEINLPLEPPEEVTCNGTSPVMSNDLIKSSESLASGASSYSENLKMETSGFTTESQDVLENVVFVAEAEPTSSLSTISGDKRKSSSASSLHSTSAILEVTNAAVVQVTEQPVRTLESTDSDSKLEQPGGQTILKRIRKTWRERFGRKKRMNEDGSVSESQEDEDTKDRSLSLKSDQISTSSKDQKEPDEDQADSLSSFSLQQPVTEPLEVRPTEEDEDHVTEINLPLQPPVEEEEPVLSKEIMCVSHSPIRSKYQIRSDESESLASGDSSCFKNIVTTETSGFTTESPDTCEEAAFVTEAGPTSRLSTLSGDRRKSSSTSSLCSTSAMMEMTYVGVAQGTEQSVRMLESTDSDSKTEQSAGSLFKRIKESWRKRFGRKKNIEDGSVSESHEDEDTKTRSLSLKSDQMSISSKKEPDEDPTDSLSSFSLQQPVTQPLKVRPTEKDEGHVTKINLPSGPPEEAVLSKEITCLSTCPVMAGDQINSEESRSVASGVCSCFENAVLENIFHADLVKEVFVAEVESTSKRKSPSASSPCSTSAILEAQTEHLSSFGLHQLYTGPLEVRPTEDGPPGEEQENSDSGNDQQLVLNPSVFSIILETFFHHLTEEQWREVGEGVYNHDVLEKLIYMCMTVLRFISNAVVKVVLLSLNQSSDTCGASPMTSEDLLRDYNIDIRGFVESCFSQAVCEVIGADMPVRVSPDFTDTLATEVLQEVNSVLSVTQQASVDGAPTISDSSQESTKRAAEKSVGGLIATMKSFLTGRATAVRRRIETPTDPEAKSMEETPGRGAVMKSKQSLWSRCVRRQESRKMQLDPLQEDCGKEDMRIPHSFISSTFEERTRSRNSFSSKEKQKMDKE